MTSTKRRKTTAAPVTPEAEASQTSENACGPCEGKGFVYTTVGRGRNAIKDHGAVCLTCMGSGVAA